jgi:sugar lactone lactonase YvrE
MRTRAAEVALRIDAMLGEGAIWDRTSERLLWVDILKKRVGIFDPQSGRNETLQLDSLVGTVVPTSRGDLLVALQEGVARLDRRTGRISAVRAPAGHDAATVRFNDGKCDPRGRLWAGTMGLEAAPKAGALYRFDPDGTNRRMLEGVTISNGIVWRLDHRSMYYIDSMTRGVDAFDFDVETGTIAGRRRVISVAPDLGFPDGMTIDAEGNLWIALWDGWGVGCWSPETGQLLGKLSVPAARVTSCAFGGDKLASLFITTARQGLSEEELRGQSLAGSVFVASVEVHGVGAFSYID